MAKIKEKYRCIKCGRCLRTCSNYSLNEDRDYIAYAAINKNKEILSQSTSGGAFFALVEKLFSKENSVCYGVAYTKDLEKALDFKYQVEQELGIKITYVDHLSLSVSTHIGPGALAITSAKIIK